MSVAEIVAGAVKGTGDIGLGIYNAWRTQKNQEIQWEREDNALQRRVKDAEKAGFNKWSQLGSNGASSSTAIQAGTVDQDVSGGAVDALSSMYRLASERAQSKYNQEQAEIAKNNKEMSDNAVMVNNWETAMNIAGLMKDAGFTVDPIRAKVKGYKDGRPDKFSPILPTPAGDLFSSIKYDDDGWNFTVTGKKDSWLERAYNNRMLDLYANQEQNQITGDLAQVSGVIKILQGLFGTVRDASSAYRSFRGKKK